MDVARHVTQCFREEHMRGVRRLAGNRYSPNAAAKRTYINLISLYVNIVSRSLISNNPRAMLSTFDRAQKATVSAAETWLNQELVRQNFAGTMRRIVLDALFSVGIGKVSIGTPANSALVGWRLKAGEPYIARVNLDDFVFDHRARDFDEVSFIGHRYRVPLEIARNDPHFSKKARENLQAQDQIQYNQEGDERIGEIGRFHYGSDEDMEEMIELWEVYLPRHRCVKTFSEDDLSGPTSAWDGQTPTALREQDWIGPETGPYKILAFQILPGQIFPKGPIQDLIELDEAANESYRKLMRQAARLKINTVCSSSNPEDGEALRTANDGDNVPVQDPKAVSEIVQGGPHGGLFQWMKDVVDRFMVMGGNLLTMGGLAPQAGTLGQEELLAQQSNGQVASMQDSTVTFVSDVCSSALWYFWNDPRLVMKSPVNDPRLPDVDYVREVFPWNHADPGQLRRTGDVPDLKIDPYSMRHSTPQQRVKDLMQVVTQVYVPMAALAQQQNIAFDFNAFLGIVAKYLDAPDLQSILTIQEQQGDVGNAGESTETGPKPAQTSREYVRRSIGGQSRQAQEMESDNELSMAAAGSNGKMSGQMY